MLYSGRLSLVGGADSPDTCPHSRTDGQRTISVLPVNKVWVLGLRAFWCVWLSSLLPRAVVTLEWHSSLMGLLAGCVGTGVVLEGRLLPDLGRLDGLSGRRTWG